LRKPAASGWLFSLGQGSADGRDGSVIEVLAEADSEKPAAVE